MTDRDQNILVTGASGLLGSALVRAMRSAGHAKVLTPGRNELDLLDRQAVNDYFEKHRPVAVYHLAALVFGLGGNSRNQFRSLSENGRANDNLFCAMASYPPRDVFFAGTVASYSFPYKSMPLQENDFFDGMPHGGEIGYAMAKRQAYSYLDILSGEKGLRYTYGVLTNLYGPGDRFDIANGHVVPSLIAKAHAAAQENKDLHVWGDGSATRDFLYVDDAARAILHCVSRHGEPEMTDRLVNISSGEEVTIRHLAECVSDGFGGIEIVYEPTGAVGVPKRVIDNSILRASGFTGFTPISEGISKTCLWYKENFGNLRT